MGICLNRWWFHWCIALGLGACASAGDFDSSQAKSRDAALQRMDAASVLVDSGISAMLDANTVQDAARPLDASVQDAAVLVDAQSTPDAPLPPPPDPCSVNRIRLWGKVYITNDVFNTSAIKIRERDVDYAFLDLIVEMERFPNAANSCGRWYEVDNINDADFVVRYVSSFSDIEIAMTGGVPLAGRTLNSSLPQ